MGYSEEARANAALARKIKSRAGIAAYDLFKKNGTIPAGLDNMKPGAGLKSAVRKPSTDARAAAATPRLPATKVDKSAKLAQAFPILSEKSFLTSMANRPRKPSVESLRELAVAQAKEDLTNEKLIDHYKKSKIFVRRGVDHNEVRQMRDDFHAGKPVPLFFAPVGTPVAVLASSDAESPDIIGKVVGTSERRLPEESGGLMKASVPYVLVQSDDGEFYEYPSLLSASRNSPHVVHPSFVAAGPIAKGLDFIPQLGWGHVTFYHGPNAGPVGGHAMQKEDELIQTMGRAARAAEAREKRRVELHGK